MATATYSRHKKQNLKIWMVVLFGCAIWFAYDGYANKGFIEKHTIEGKADSTLNFNRKSPPIFVLGSALFGAILFMRKDRKIETDDRGIILANGNRIDFDAIEQVVKTNFEKKGKFELVYRTGGREERQIFSRYQYDNMEAVLDEVISKIS